MDQRITITVIRCPTIELHHKHVQALSKGVLEAVRVNPSNESGKLFWRLIVGSVEWSFYPWTYPVTRLDRVGMYMRPASPNDSCDGEILTRKDEPVKESLRNLIETWPPTTWQKGRIRFKKLRDLCGISWPESSHEETYCDIGCIHIEGLTC